MNSRYSRDGSMSPTPMPSKMSADFVILLTLTDRFITSFFKGMCISNCESKGKHIFLVEMNMPFSERLVMVPV